RSRYTQRIRLETERKRLSLRSRHADRGVDVWQHCRRRHKRRVRRGRIFHSPTGEAWCELQCGCCRRAVRDAIRCQVHGCCKADVNNYLSSEQRLLQKFYLGRCNYGHGNKHGNRSDRPSKHQASWYEQILEWLV